MTYEADLGAKGASIDAAFAAQQSWSDGLVASIAVKDADIAGKAATIADLTARLAAATAPPKPVGFGLPMPVVTGWGPLVYSEDFLTDVPEGGFPADGSGGPYKSIRHYPKGWLTSQGTGTYDPALASVSGSVHTLKVKAVADGKGGYVITGSAMSPLIPAPFKFGRIDQAVCFDIPPGMKVANLFWGDDPTGKESTDATWKRCGEIDMIEWDGSDHFESVLHRLVNPAGLQEVRTSPAGFDWRKPFIHSTRRTPSGVGFYLNDVLMAWRTSAPSLVTGTALPASPMHMVIQLEPSLNGIKVAGPVVGTFRTDWIQAWAYKA